jgi:hypothetical protein
MRWTRCPATVRGRGRLLVSFAAVGVALVAGACSSSPSAAAYRTAANTVCRSYTPALRTVYSAVALSSVRGDVQLKAVLAHDLPSIESGSSRLEGLAQPTGNERALQRALTDETAQVSSLEALETALEHGDRSRVQSSASALARQEASLNLQFNLLGLTSCGTASVAT